MAWLWIAPEWAGETVGETPQTPRVTATRQEVAQSMEQYAKALVLQIQSMEQQTIALIQAFQGSYGKQLLLKQIALGKIYENLWVFVRDFTWKYSFGYFKTQAPELLHLIRLTQIQLDAQFEQAKKNIEAYINTHFQ